MGKALLYLEIVWVAYLLLIVPHLRAFTLSKSFSGSGRGDEATKVRTKKSLTNSNLFFEDTSGGDLTEKGYKLRIGIIADLDKASETNGSYLRQGNMFVQYNPASPKESIVSVEWDSGSPLAIPPDGKGGRGMEMSLLVVFNSKLYTCDDKTGTVYELPTGPGSSRAIPWVILKAGDGTVEKGFKCEWGCVKGDYLWIGGTGKPWVSHTGEIVHHYAQYVKRISRTGEVTHIDWRTNYKRIAAELGISFPGYVVHESGGWSDRLNQWMFLPRRASNQSYTYKTDERMATNVIILANEDFSKINVRTVGEIVPTKGFSSFKWIPRTNDQLVVALKTEEIEDRMASFIIVFDIEGNIILPETKIEDEKYEGIEFV